jgi:UDP-galactose transporter B1
MIPVMIMGTIIGGKFYTPLEYGCAMLIAAGISLFAKQSSAKVTSKLVAPNAPLGYMLCFFNLMFDGYTNAMQVSMPCNDRPALW